MRDPRIVISHAGSRILARDADERRADDVPGQYARQDEGHAARKPDSRGAQRQFAIHRRRGFGREQHTRWIIENDWLEAIVALPLNMFYNTGIATYVWILSNRKPDHRRGHVQLIDASKWFTPLRRNLGKKNCELSNADIERICGAFLAFEESEQSKIFPNEAFGYRKATVDRPLRLEGVDPERVYKAREIKELKEKARRSEDAPAVIKKIHRGGATPYPLHGLFERTIGGKRVVVEYEAGHLPARHRADTAAGRGRHRRFPAPRGSALRARRLARRIQVEDRLRNQLHPPLLQAGAYAKPRGDTL